MEFSNVTAREQAQVLASALGCSLEETEHRGRHLPSVVGRIAAISAVLKAHGGRWRTKAQGYSFETWNDLATALSAASLSSGSATSAT